MLGADREGAQTFATRAGAARELFVNRMAVLRSAASGSDLIGDLARDGTNDERGHGDAPKKLEE